MHRTSTTFVMVVSACAVMMTIACTPKAPNAPAATTPNTVTGPDGSILKVTAPSHVSPAENELMNTLTPSLQIQAASGQYTTDSFSYQFELQNASGSPIASQVTGTTWTLGGLALSSTYRWRARAVKDGEFGPWSGIRTFRTLSLPGCNGGVLNDPKAYFFWLINRKPGDSANDWVGVMLATGIPGGYGPGFRPPLTGLPHYGMTQQMASNGQLRGRLWLPTDTRDGLGFYTRTVDFLENGSGGLRWTWKEDSSAGAYVPRPCPQ
ncbi:MAG: hypothetical protein AB7Q29_19235 [Vicinamibacterales bacterium]